LKDNFKVEELFGFAVAFIHSSRILTSLARQYHLILYIEVELFEG